jgi:Galactose oxidase-like, Early set domain
MRVTSVTTSSEQGRIRRLLRGLASRFRPSARSPVVGWAGDAEPSSPKPAGQIDRRTFLLAGATSAVLVGGPSLNALLGGVSPQPRAPATDPAVTGQWTLPFHLGLVSIHAVLLHTGQVLLFSWPNNSVGSAAQLWDPVTGSLTDVSLTYQRDLFCSGMTVLADGRVLTAGGHLYQGVFGNGIANTTIFDPASNAWTEGPIMSQARWYPTTIELGDGTVMIFAGTIVPKVRATTVDHYDPLTNTITTLPASADKVKANYPRMKLTTSGLLAWTNLATTRLFQPATSTWTTGPKLNSGGRAASDTSVLLPGLTKIMEIGGGTSAGATNTAEILDLSSSTPSWQYTSPMHYARLWANTVLLADGSVLVVGGGTSGYYNGPIRTAERYDPVAAAWTDMAAQTAPRMYHSTALLLPDGRVLSAGQSAGNYQQSGEIFSPPYLFAGARPAISSAPGTLGYSQQFTIATPDYASIGRVALVRAGSVTHSNNFDQRYVDLTYQSDGSGGLTATSPPDSNHAPPGWYMLFILNASGVPSVASWVQVG